MDLMHGCIDSNSLWMRNVLWHRRGLRKPRMLHRLMLRKLHSLRMLLHRLRMLLQRLMLRLRMLLHRLWMLL